MPPKRVELHGSIRSYYNFLTRLSQLFCASSLQPILRKPNQSPSSKCLHRLANYLHLLWSATYVVTLPAFAFVSYRANRLDNTLVEQALFMVRFVCMAITNAMIVVRSRTRPHRHRLIDALSAMERRLDRLDDCNEVRKEAKKDTDKLRLYMRRFFAVMVASMVVIYVVDLASVGWVVADSVWTLYPYVVPTVTSSCALVQLTLALRLLEHMFGKCKFMIERVLRQHAGVHETAAVSLSERSLTPWLSGGKVRKQRRVYADEVLNALRLEYVELMGLHRCVVGEFGAIVIGIVLTGILDLVVQFYLFYKLSMNLDEMATMLTVYAGFWVVLVVGRMFVMVWQCDRVDWKVGQNSLCFFSNLNQPYSAASPNRAVDIPHRIQRTAHERAHRPAAGPVCHAAAARRESRQ